MKIRSKNLEKRRLRQKFIKNRRTRVFVGVFSWKWCPRASKKCPRDVPGVSPGLPEAPRMAPKTSQDARFGRASQKKPSKWRPRVAPRCPEAFRGTILGQKVEKIVTPAKQKTQKIRAELRRKIKTGANQKTGNNTPCATHDTWHTTHDTSNWIHTSNKIDVHIHDKTRGGRNITHATCNLHLRQYETWGGVSIVDSPLPGGWTRPARARAVHDSQNRPETPRDATRRHATTRRDATRRNETPQDVSRRLQDASETPQEVILTQIFMIFSNFRLILGPPGLHFSDAFLDTSFASFWWLFFRKFQESEKS